MVPAGRSCMRGAGTNEGRSPAGRGVWYRRPAMKLFGKDLDAEVAIVAEIGVNHEGDVEAASRLIGLARDAGADAAKLQTYTPERLASASDPERLRRVRAFQLSERDLARLADEAARAGFPLFSTAVTEDVVPLLARLFPAIKIASGDLDFEPVIRAAARTGKPMILSCGLGTMAEIETAVGWVREEVGAAALRDRLLLMHCVSAYPTPIEQANVSSVPFLRERTGLRVGYSNHVVGLEACYAAVAQGACVVEVHVTDRRAGRAFRDHALSLEPDELRRLVEAAPRIRAALGDFDKRRQPAEAPNLAAVRKGVVAARDLEAGTVLAADDLMFARPASEFPAAEAPRLIGRRLSLALARGETIRRADVGLEDA